MNNTAMGSFHQPHTEVVPGTPTHHDRNNENLKEVLKDLNDKYGLQLKEAKLAVGPKDTNQLIYSRLHFLYYRRDHFLNHALTDFYYRTLSTHIQWVHKKLADPDTIPTPSPSNPPKARTPQQRREFEELLLTVLTDIFEIARQTPTRMPPRINTNVPRSTLTDDSSSPGTPGSFDESPTSATKRASDAASYSFSMKRHRAQDLAYSPDVTPSRMHETPSRMHQMQSRVHDNTPSRTRDDSPSRSHAMPSSRMPRQDIPDVLASMPTRRTLFNGDSLGQESPQRSLESLHGRGSQFTPGPSSQMSSGNRSGSFSSSSASLSSQTSLREIRHQDPNLAGPEVIGYGQQLELVQPSPARTQTRARPPVAPSDPFLNTRAQPAVSSHAKPMTLMGAARKPSPEYIVLDDSDDELPATSLTSAQTTSSSTPDNSFNTEGMMRKAKEEVNRRLENIWPIFPEWLRSAPLAIAWELTRICLHCKVPLDDPSLKYDPTWEKSDMSAIWRSLHQLDVFRGKSFPEKPSAEAFAAALNNFESRGNTVVMSAALEFNPDDSGPLFILDMKPLRFDEGCRLTRRFGPDRFLEILVPLPTWYRAPKIFKDGNAEEVISWLTERPHYLVGRVWQAFYSKDAGYRKPAKDLMLSSEDEHVPKERVHFFAEDGVGFSRVKISSGSDIPMDNPSQRIQLKTSYMLEWLLQLENNQDQPHLKLFSRIQLGLSKTTPTITFEPHQIWHRPKDLLSPIGKVMNDGIGRMSRTVAKKIRDALGLTDIPSAIQGRIGSAKGMWLMDVADTSDEIWIETFPSQRKWVCDFRDPFHRTLEVRSVASELKPAGLNMQFLPVLEDRAKDPRRMREAIGNRLMNGLQRQFDEQKTALKRPLQFRQWVYENGGHRGDRVRHGQVPFLGGLPQSKSEIQTLLLNAGFDPMAQRYLQDLAWELQKQKCETLRTKLNIRVGRSAYAYMVVDFWGVLEEGEVHLGFSSKFRDECDDVSYTILADTDVLVARSPAHFPSDIQKVRAVFRPELHALKDVIVFSSKGNVPLADKLSGGDYDGDLAWVCWDPDIVENFVNAEVPPSPDLSDYLVKDQTTFAELVHNNSWAGAGAVHAAAYEMINKSFQFAMQPNYLGICTNYKEHFCYHQNSVSNDAALLLSALVGNLVDQSKQGIIFTADAWNRIRKERLGGKISLPKPAYKENHWDASTPPRHIIDHLKFNIAKPAIDKELQNFSQMMKGSSQEGAHFWDPDLAIYHNELEELAEKSKSLKALLPNLRAAIDGVRNEWGKISVAPLTYPEKVKHVYAKWQAIDINSVCTTGSNTLSDKIRRLMEQRALVERGAGATSYWSLLKASVAFKTYYNSESGVKFVWQMAGYQLCFIKAQVSSGRGFGDGMPVLMTQTMYAGSIPDGRFVKQYIARLEGDGSDSMLLEDEDGPECMREDDVE